MNAVPLNCPLSFSNIRVSLIRPNFKISLKMLTGEKSEIKKGSDIEKGRLEIIKCFKSIFKTFFLLGSLIATLIFDPSIKAPSSSKLFDADS